MLGTVSFFLPPCRAKYAGGKWICFRSQSKCCINKAMQDAGNVILLTDLHYIFPPVPCMPLHLNPFAQNDTLRLTGCDFSDTLQKNPHDKDCGL